MSAIIELNNNNIYSEHICCAISDKKCQEGYELKKKWMKNEFDNGFKFKRLNERAKVFIEYQESENAWMPIKIENYLIINCFWVSGKYKGKGHGIALLNEVFSDAKENNKDGVIALAGIKKMHFMNDGTYLKAHGFEVADTMYDKVNLLFKNINKNAAIPKFIENKKDEEKDNTIKVYYSNRCPFTDFHVNTNLIDTCEVKNINLEIVKIESHKEAQELLIPSSIFSLFYNNEFITTDVSICMPSRFEKILKI